MPERCYLPRSVRGLPAEERGGTLVVHNTPPECEGCLKGAFNDAAVPKVTEIYTEAGIKRGGLDEMRLKVTSRPGALVGVRERVITTGDGVVVERRETALFRCELAQAAFGGVNGNRQLPDERMVEFLAQHGIPDEPEWNEARLARTIEMMIAPAEATESTGRDDSIMGLFYEQLAMGRFDYAIRAVEFTLAHLRKNPGETVVATENELSEERITRLLMMAADMPREMPIEHRLFVWQKIFEADALQVAEHSFELEHALSRMHTGDRRMAERVDGVLRAVIIAKLHKLRDTQGLLKLAGIRQGLTEEKLIEALRFGDLAQHSPFYVITNHFPQAQGLYESINVLLGAKQKTMSLKEFERIRS